MAGQRSSVWGIDIGQCALKALKLSFDAKADRAVANAFDYIEHPKILSQPDADPDELVRAALEKFASRNDIDGSEVYISIPGQAGLSRFVKLPPVEPKKIPDIVNFEARQQIPFALDDVVWDYQRIGGGDEEGGDGPVEVEVGIFAIRKDAVRKYLEPFQSRNIDVNVVQLAPVALYNFTAFDIIYHAAHAAGEGSESEEEDGDTVVVLDIGADKTDVVITDGDSIWLRNLPIGGNHFTRALTKDLKLSFAKAEHLKRNATKAPDPKKLYQAMRPVFQDFASELQRSIGYFASTHRGSVIRKVVGMGGGFRLPGLQKFLQQNLQYRIDKVSKFHGLVGDEIVTAPAFAENLMSFCVAYGLSLQGLHQTPIQTNLLPGEIRTARLVRDKKPWSLVAAAGLLLGCAATFIGNYFLLKQVSADTFKGPSQQAMSTAQQFKQHADKFKQAESSFQAATDKANQLIGADRIKDRDFWLKAMRIIDEAIPPRTDKDVTDVTNLEEVNLNMVQAVYLPAATEWLTKLSPDAQQTMVPTDRNQPPQGPGWLFQVRGYTFNQGTRVFVQNSILQRLQSPAMAQKGISHAVITMYETKPDWTPSSGAVLQTIPQVGKGHKEETYSTAQVSKAQARPRVGTANEDKDDKYADLPEDMKEYMKRSEEQNKNAGKTSKITRTDFLIEFVWRPDAVQQPGAIPEVPVPGTPGAPVPGVPAPGTPGVPVPAAPAPAAAPLTGVPGTPVPPVGPAGN